MKPEDINRAIAEHCGWQHKTHGTDTYWWNDNINDGELLSLPNYNADLNEMHEAEKYLDEEQTITQIMLMLPPPFCDRPSWRGMAMLLQATAAQRAEAFLRTVGKWNDQ